MGFIGLQPPLLVGTAPHQRKVAINGTRGERSFVWTVFWLEIAVLG